MVASSDAGVETPTTAVAVSLHEAAVVDEHLERLSLLQTVIEQVERLENPLLLMDLQRAYHDEERRARGVRQENPRVAHALIARQQAEQLEMARKRKEMDDIKRQKASVRKDQDKLKEIEARVKRVREIVRASIMASVTPLPASSS